MIRVTAALALFGLIIGCGGLDKKMVATWTQSEQALMAELASYAKVDPATMAKITAHLANVQTGIKSVPAEEESTLMGLLLNYVQADPQLSAARKLTRGDLIKAHLDDFTSLTR